MKTHITNRWLDAARRFQVGLLALAALLTLLAGVELGAAVYGDMRTVPHAVPGATEWEPASFAAGGRQRGQDGGLLGSVGFDPHSSSSSGRVPSNQDRWHGQDGGLLSGDAYVSSSDFLRSRAAAPYVSSSDFLRSEASSGVDQGSSSQDRRRGQEGGLLSN